MALEGALPCRPGKADRATHSIRRMEINGFRSIKSEHSYGKYCLTTSPHDLSIRGRRNARILCSEQGSFRFGTVKRQVGGEDEDAGSSNGAAKLGTQGLRFGTRSGSAGKLSTKSSPLPSLGRRRRAPDPKTVFVAGATGQTGARISQQLLRSGFSVRGGVRDLFYAQQLAEFASQYGVISREEARRLNAVECDFKDAESIAKAIGNAGKVVITIGPTEDGPRGKVTPTNALQVVEAASLANAGHVVIVCETGGTSNSRNPLNGITQFFARFLSLEGGLTPDSLLDSIVEMDLRFTFIKAGSTEGVDDFYPTGNIVLLSEGTYRQGTGSVSKAQLASVVASVFENVASAENKVVEVASIASAEPRPLEELLSAIPIDGRRAALAQARSKAEEEERQRRVREQAETEAKLAEEEARRAAEVANQLEQEAKRIAAQETRATAMAQKAKAKAEQAAAKMKELGFNLTSKLTSSSEGTLKGYLAKTFSSKTTEGVEAGIRSTNKAEPDGKLGFRALFNRDSSEKEEDSSSKKPAISKFFSSRGSSDADGNPGLGRKLLDRSAKTRGKPSSSKSEPKNILGGLFKQETIYADDD